MNRRHLTFRCEAAQLVGTLDEGSASTGLLLVSGGNEVRSGAWAGHAQLAARLASEHVPVFRYDRRGIGDSEGVNGGYRSGGPDIAAALAAFRAGCPQLTRVIGFGNCDAASALMLAQGAGLDGLVLGNPWTIEDEAAPPPPAAVRDHYKRRLADPAAIKRLLTGKVSLRQLFTSLRSAAQPAPQAANALAQELCDGIAGFKGPIAFLLAERDRTARAFLANWPKGDTRIRQCPGASHSFVEPEARDWLTAQLLEMLRA